jgi:hypothetical protein
MKKYFHTSLLSIIPLICCILLLELILRAIGVPKEMVIKKDDSDFIQYDENLGYTYLPNLDISISNDNYNINIKTNSLGHRNKELTLSNSDIKILVVGNSYSVGYGVAEETRWSNQLESFFKNSSQRCFIYNASVSGYSLGQMISSAKQLQPKINPNFIIVGLYFNGINRISDPYMYYESFCVRCSKINHTVFKTDRMILTHFSNKQIKALEAFMLDHSVLANFIISRLVVAKQMLHQNPQENESSDLMVCKKIQSFKASVEEGVELVILPILQHDKNKIFSKNQINQYHKLKSCCEQNDIIFVHLLPSMEAKLETSSFWIKNDTHWNEYAHKIAAQSIFKCLSNQLK